jgi:hypothetical protein
MVGREIVVAAVVDVGVGNSRVDRWLVVVHMQLRVYWQRAEEV